MPRALVLYNGAMEVVFRCPTCEQTGRSPLDKETTGITCASCEQVCRVPEGAVGEQSLTRCVICRSHDLFIRKDFPQRLGVMIVVAGSIASCYAWYRHQLFLTFGILFITAAIDVLLYLLVRDAIVCYRCGAHYRGFDDDDGHAAFNLEVHERYRQESARHEAIANRTSDSDQNLSPRI